jgi:hypothetical protein
MQTLDPVLKPIVVRAAFTYPRVFYLHRSTID